MLADITPTTSILTLGKRTFLNETEAFLLPVHTPLYHGSSSIELTIQNAPFPVGRFKYAPDSNMEEADISYYSSYDVARYYAGKGIIMAFETCRPLTLFHLSVCNLEKFWPKFPSAVRNTIRTLYGFSPGVKLLTRPKGSKTDASWVKWLASETDALFDGVFVDRFWRDMNERSSYSLQIASQDEVILFDACSVLTRNLTNPLDWQHSPFLHLPRAIHLLRKQMTHYKTTNIRSHAGNLWEHSIWSCLWVERLPHLMGVDHVDDAIVKRWAAIALLHDLGKCRPDLCQQRGDTFVYYAQPNHPKMGKNYLTGQEPFPMIQDDGRVVADAMFIPSLLETLGLEEWVDDAALVLLRHWDLGPLLRTWKMRGFSTSVAASFFPGIDTEVKKCLFFVSLADILAAQPPSPQIPMQNVASRFWPLVNVPRNYKGAQIYEKRIGLTCLSDAVLFYHQVFGGGLDMECDD